MGGSSPPPAPANPYTGLSQANTQSLSGMQNLQSMPNYAQNLFGNYGSGLASMLNPTTYNPQDIVNQGNFLSGQGAGMFGQGQQLMNMGLDPQGAYYNQAFQQNLDQTRAAEAARGIATTPYGAGLENMSNQQFNNMWQNQQAMRASQLAGAAQGLYGQGTHTMGSGAGLAAATPTMQMQQLLGLQQAGMNSYALPQQATQNWLNYLNQGTQSQNQAYQNQMQAWQSGQQQSSQNTQAIASAAMMAAMMMMSDRRLKEDITQIGEAFDGTPIYRYRLKGSPQWQIGFMADEVEAHAPDAVATNEHGFKMVDYKRATDLSVAMAEAE